MSSQENAHIRSVMIKPKSAGVLSGAKETAAKVEKAKEHTETMKKKMNLGVHHNGFTVYREAIRSGQSCRGMPSLAVEAMKARSLQFDPQASRMQALVKMAYVPVHHHVIRYLEGLDEERIEGESAPSIVGRSGLSTLMRRLASLCR
jgi:hypothetical protein